MTSLVLPSVASSAGTARRFVHEQCAGHLPDELADDGALLVSELVTNALVHGRSDARLTVQVGERLLRVEVSDDNSRHPHYVAEDPEALDGRGLTILEALATRWGVREEPIGKTVWFEISA